MADGDAGRCEPYRVEWRYNLTENWCLLGLEATIGEAEHVAAHALHEWGGQARVVEQRVVLVRGLGQDTGPDQAFMDWQQMQPPPFRAEMRHGAFLRDHEQRMDKVADAIDRLRESDRGASSEPEESEQAMPDGLFFSERELWEDTATWTAVRERRRVRDLLARLARVRAQLRAPGQPATYVLQGRSARTDELRGEPKPIALRGGRFLAAITGADGDEVAWYVEAARPSVVSDPDDRRDVEAAADAGQPLDQARTILNQLADTDTQRQAIRDATVTDTAGCAHRMSSGAVSLTACGECGAEPGDDCMAWRVLDASDEDMTEVERVLDATAAKIGGTSPLEAVMLYTAAEVDALLAEHGKPPGPDPLEDRVRAAEERYDERERLKADMSKPFYPDPWWRRLLHRTRQ